MDVRDVCSRLYPQSPARCQPTTDGPDAESNTTPAGSALPPQSPGRSGRYAVTRPLPSRSFGHGRGRSSSASAGRRRARRTLCTPARCHSWRLRLQHAGGGRNDTYDYRRRPCCARRTGGDSHGVCNNHTGARGRATRQPRLPCSFRPLRQRSPPSLRHGHDHTHIHRVRTGRRQLRQRDRRSSADARQRRTARSTCRSRASCARKEAPVATLPATDLERSLSPAEPAGSAEREAAVSYQSRRQASPCRATPRITAGR